MSWKGPDLAITFTAAEDTLPQGNLLGRHKAIADEDDGRLSQNCHGYLQVMLLQRSQRLVQKRHALSQRLHLGKRAVSERQRGLCIIKKGLQMITCKEIRSQHLHNAKK